MRFLIGLTFGLALGAVATALLTGASGEALLGSVRSGGGRSAGPGA
ncbi:MAG: hypothetical protein O6913_01445 [Chloroflexi bacterium]|jgi:hypothetical protein|nr:hypothetical protein [Chloroflexota bacterium]MCZ6707414.1 hypothetical protein [Chloroflexota bacterium]